MDERRTAAIFKAFCDENRIRIIKLLRSGEKCACKLLEEINVTQPTLSHHMKILNECGLVNDWKEGRWHHYSLNCETLNAFKTFIEGLSCCKEESGCCQ